jgi:hypothetical protein
MLFSRPQDPVAGFYGHVDDISVSVKAVMFGRDDLSAVVCYRFGDLENLWSSISCLHFEV